MRGEGLTRRQESHRLRGTSPRERKREREGERERGREREREKNRRESRLKNVRCTLHSNKIIFDIEKT